MVLILSPQAGLTRRTFRVSAFFELGEFFIHDGLVPLLHLAAANDLFPLATLGPFEGLYIVLPDI